MFGEEVILEKAISYITFRVKKGHEEKEARRELLQNLKYLAKFYEDTINSFHKSNHKKVLLLNNDYQTSIPQNSPFNNTQESFVINLPKLDLVINSIKANNIWQYLEFDRIFMVENKTNIDYLIEYNRHICELNKEIAGCTADGYPVLHWTAQHIWTYSDLLMQIQNYILHLESQLKQVKKLTEAIHEIQK